MIVNAVVIQHISSVIMGNMIIIFKYVSYIKMMEIIYKSTINQALVVLLVILTIYGTYCTFMRYKTKQSIMFWIIEIFHHFITMFIFIGLFVQNQSFYFTVTHLLITTFTLIHWYFNTYILKINKCILTALSNHLVKSKYYYNYDNPLKQILGMYTYPGYIKSRECKANYLSSKPEILDIIVLTGIIINDIYVLKNSHL